MEVRRRHTKRLTDSKLRPLAYWASPGRFNLTALLQSGRFYLDEAGLLVAPNGTKYRIPSGPPEGRKPLRPDRPTQERFEPTRQGDLFTSEQQDSNKLSHWGLAKTPQLQDDSNFPVLSSPMKSTLNPMNQTIMSPGKSNLIGTDGTIESVIPIAAQLDWNVILLTVILSSIALVCNLALVVFLSWKINRFRVGSCNRLRSTLPQRGHSNPLDHIQSNLIECGNPTQCYCLHDGVQSSTEPARTNEYSYETKMGTYPAHMTERDPLSLHTRLSRRYRHRRGRRRRPTSNRRLTHGFCEGDPLMNHRDPLHMDPKAHILRTEMSLLGDLGPATPFLNTMDHVEVGSSSGGSWHMVVSDGMISETTADEEDNNEENTTTGGDSGTNSDILYRGQRHATRSRISATNRGFHRSDSTPEDIGRIKKLRAVMAFSNGSRNTRMDAKRSRLETIKSDHFTQSGCGSSASRSNSSSTVEAGLNRSVLLQNISPNETNYLCHSLGIHLGLLGIILSLIQLIVVCSALSRRMVDVNHNGAQTGSRAGSYLSELGCVMATSLAADTLLCARQYVLAAILLVFWTTSYMTLVGRVTKGNPKITLSSFCLVKSSGLREQNPGTVVPDHSRRQQRYAYLALTHSLPWAVAAGTALLITFALPSIPIEDNAQVKLNLFFHGLDSLLVCQVDPKHSSRITITDLGIVERNSSSITTTAFAAQNWLAWSLLIFIPLCIHILLSIVYAILIRLGMRQIQDLKRLRRTKLETSRIVCYVFGSLLALVSLEHLSCAVPIVWSMFTSYKMRTVPSEQPRPSPFVYRLIILHLLLDPWLIACLIRPIMTQMTYSLNRNQSVNNSPTSELALRSWTKEPPPPPPPQENPGNSAYHSKGIDFAGRPISSVGFMGCFPVAGRISNSDSRAMTVSPTGQALLMPCVPNTNFYVSPLQTLAHSAGLDNRLVLPLNERSIRVSQSQSDALAVGPYPSNHGSLSMSMTFANPARSPIIDSLTAVQPTSQTTTDTDVFPQLCEHHQKLLEQHYAVRLPGPSSGTISSTTATTLQLGPVRAFGQVPRINPANLNFTDPLMMKSIIQVTPEDSCTTSASANEPVASTHIIQQNCPVFEQSPSSEEPGKYVPTRPPAGQSQATAAVMAAAAAAVAAQAGTMSRSNTEHTGTDLTHSSALSPQILPQSQQQHEQQQPSAEFKKPSHHSNLSSTARFRTTDSPHQTYSKDLIQQE